MGEIKYLKDFSYEIIEHVRDTNGIQNGKRSIFYFLTAERVDINPIEGVRIILIYPYEWSLHMTPWKYNGKGMDKTGGGDKFIEIFHDIYGHTGGYGDLHNYIGGYSLGGLMAMYMAYRCSMFAGVASVSGSMWYPGAVSFFAANHINENIEKVYISLGDKEALTKSPERAKVEYNTTKIAETLKNGPRVIYEKNPGGHFTDVGGRIEKAIKALT